MIGFAVTLIAMCLMQINNYDECLHCGDDKAEYCEKCYQMLVAENLTLQIEIENLMKEKRK